MEAEARYRIEEQVRQGRHVVLVTAISPLFRGPLWARAVRGYRRSVSNRRYRNDGCS
jgi:hypothetical protein